MLKITIRPEGQSTTLLLEGRLAGPWVQELDRCWRQISVDQPIRVIVDLHNVTFVDAEGKGMLRQMRKQGAELHASGCLMRCIVEEIAKEEC